MGSGTDATFCKLPHWLLERADLGFSAKCLWAYLSDRIGTNGKCWPGIRRISRDMGTDHKVIIRAAKELESVGLLTVARATGNPGGQSNQYRIVSAPTCGSAPESPALPKRDRERSRIAHGSAPESPTQPDPLTRPIEPDTKALPKKAIHLNAEHLSIYEAYPRHVGRASAMKAIAKAVERVSGNPDPPEDPVLFLRERAATYAACVKGKTDERYIPHPATWFNDERYLDDMLLPGFVPSVAVAEAAPGKVVAKEGKYARFDR